MQQLDKAEIEEIIRDEILVDTYGDEEAALGWQTFLDDHLVFPFQAACQFQTPRGKKVVLELPIVGEFSMEAHPEYGDFYVQALFHEVLIRVGLDDLQPTDAEEETIRGIQVWQGRRRIN